MAFVMLPPWAAVIVVIGAVLIDWFLGEPPNPIHPVVWIGTAVGLLTPAQLLGKRAEWWPGVGLALLMVVAGGAAGYVVSGVLGGWMELRMLVETALLSCLLSLRGLVAAGRRMTAALGDSLTAGREALSWLCSRRPDKLSEPELVAATVESIAENASDSVVAPICFYMLFGLPGAAVYRVANTLDAMVGYHGRFEYFGKFSARLDDVLNLIPARLTAGLLLLAGLTAGRPVASGLRVLRRDRYRTQSPNAGFPMATMAGLLGVCLEKPGAYRLGDGPAPAGSTHIAGASTLVVRASVILIGLLTLVALTMMTVGGGHGQ